MANPIDYKNYLASAAWRAKRLEVLERDGYRCRICSAGDDDARLEVHHSTYESLGDEPLNHLITVCRHCHPIADQCQKKRRDRLGLANQVRVNPGDFTDRVEDSNPITISRSKPYDLSAFAGAIEERRPPIDAQRPNRRPFEQIRQSDEGGQQ